MKAVPIDHRTIGLPRLPFLAAAFVTLVCVAILALSGWREWTSPGVDLRNAEVDMTNLARSLTQHAEDTIELADAALFGLASRLETNGTDPAAIARVQHVLDLRKETLGRIRGLFVYDQTGRWLTTTEKVSLERLNNSDRAYFQHHRAQGDPRLSGPTRKKPFREPMDHHGLPLLQPSRRDFRGRGPRDHRHCLFRSVLIVSLTSDPTAPLPCSAPTAS